MFTVLWCYLRNPAFKKDGVDYHVAADLTGQANHIGVTIEADIIKQKPPESNNGYGAIKFGHTNPLVYDKLCAGDNPIEWTRWQVANCYMGRSPLINSGGASGKNDLAEAVLTAVVNKRAGGSGLISGRKAFQKPMAEGVELLQRDPGRLPLQGRHRRVEAGNRVEGRRKREDGRQPEHGLLPPSGFSVFRLPSSLFPLPLGLVGRSSRATSRHASAYSR